VACVPLLLYLMGAVFLALTALFVLDAKVVRPANQRDGLEPAPRRSAPLSLVNAKMNEPFRPDCA
jgi:hypothetical protein